MCWLLLPSCLPPPTLTHWINLDMPKGFWSLEIVKLDLSSHLNVCVLFINTGNLYWYPFCLFKITLRNKFPRRWQPTQLFRCTGRWGCSELPILIYPSYSPLASTYPDPPLLSFWWYLFSSLPAFLLLITHSFFCFPQFSFSSLPQQLLPCHLRGWDTLSYTPIILT